MFCVVPASLPLPLCPRQSGNIQANSAGDTPDDDCRQSCKTGTRTRTRSGSKRGSGRVAGRRRSQLSSRLSRTVFVHQVARMDRQGHPRLSGTRCQDAAPWALSGPSPRLGAPQINNRLRSRLHPSPQAIDAAAKAARRHNRAGSRTFARPGGQPVRSVSGPGLDSGLYQPSAPLALFVIKCCHLVRSWVICLGSRGPLARVTYPCRMARIKVYLMWRGWARLEGKQRPLAPWILLVRPLLRVEDRGEQADSRTPPP